MLLISLTTQHNSTLYYMDMEEGRDRGRGSHVLVRWKAWHFLSFLGLFGTFSNFFLLYTFYVERQYLATSVNTMICMDTLYRFVYSTFGVHWRDYNMVHQKGLFFEREKVCYLQIERN